MAQVPDNLPDLHKQVMRCTWCDLSQSRTMAVPGAGDPETRLMFVGEAPGFHEDRQGLPFVGAAGKLLDEMLASIGLDRSDVFITNIIKCRPPNNRDPAPGEIEACAPYLGKQVDLINPEIIATLGRHSMTRFLGGAQSITRIHGQARTRGGRIIIPIVHPAAALRQSRYRDMLQEDFLTLQRLLSGELRPQESDDGGTQEDRDGPPAQLSFL